LPIPDFIITKAPFRVSFAGGGTDLASYYKSDYGAVVSTAIDKYVYVIINQCRPILHRGVDDISRHRIRLSYSSTENVEHAVDLTHPIVRESMRLLDLDTPMDIATMADVPAGTGLGSSGTFSVALLHALHLSKGEEVDREQLASEAAKVEIQCLDRPVGKQDHYASAYGGLNAIRFNSDESVDVRPLGNSREMIEQLFPNLLLLYTGVSRDAATILSEQNQNSSALTSELTSIRRDAETVEGLLAGNLDIESFGQVLHETWSSKRKLSSSISNGDIDHWYNTAMKAGAIGGKLCGAGGGGFLLLVVKPEQRAAVNQALGDLSELSIGYEPRGSISLLHMD
jgi:D-glycero-alpha-D-manno-heptose-7-phosphate kinase